MWGTYFFAFGLPFALPFAADFAAGLRGGFDRRRLRGNHRLLLGSRLPPLPLSNCSTSSGTASVSIFHFRNLRRFQRPLARRRARPSSTPVEQRRFARIHFGRRRLFVAEIVVAMAGAASHLGGDAVHDGHHGVIHHALAADAKIVDIVAEANITRNMASPRGKRFRPAVPDARSQLDWRGIDRRLGLWQDPLRRLESDVFANAQAAGIGLEQIADRQRLARFAQRFPGIVLVNASISPC